MKSTRYFFLFVFASLIGLQAFALQCVDLFKTTGEKPAYSFRLNEASHTLSQIVRDNHLDYAYFVKKYPQQLKQSHPELYPLLMQLNQHKAWIAGDNHSGNYIVAPFRGRMQYFFTDIKDGGYGPMFFNFANLVLNTHAVTKRTDSAKIHQVADILIEAYLQGLRGENMRPPKPIADALNTKISDYREMQREDTEKFMNKEKTGFSFNKKNILPLTMPAKDRDVLVKQMTALAMNSGLVERVLDFAVRPKDRGGSKELERFWALVELKSGDFRIVEFKEINLPAAQAVEHSGLSLKDHTLKMMSVYFPSQDPLIKPVELDGRLFMMRPRKIDLISVPYRQKNQDQVMELLSFARYAAFQTGKKQALTTNDIHHYIGLIEKNPEEFQLLIRQLVKDYYTHLKEKIEESQN